MAKAYWIAFYHSISDPEAMKKYAELVGLETEGHWVHKATDHLVMTLEEMEIFSAFVNHVSEK